MGLVYPEAIGNWLQQNEKCLEIRENAAYL